MSFECDNWSDARGKASEKLFESLRKQPRTKQDATGIAGLANESAASSSGGSRKRRRDGVVVKTEYAQAVGSQAEAELQQASARRIAAAQREVTGAARAQKHQKRQHNDDHGAPLTPVSHNLGQDTYRQLGKITHDNSGDAAPTVAGMGRPSAPAVSMPMTQYASRTVVDLTLSDDDVKPSVCVEASKHHDESATVGGSGIWAVKVGWLPGVYHQAWEAELQTKHYPGSEKRQFGSVQLAQRWLAEASDRSAKDSIGRPQHTDRIDRLEFSKFLSRTWDRRNNRQYGPRAMVKKLRYLFMQACADVVHEVDWWKHPLPQELLYYEVHGQWPMLVVDQETPPPKPLSLMLGLQPFALRPRHIAPPPATQPTWAQNAHLHAPAASMLPDTHPASTVDPGSSMPGTPDPATSSPTADSAYPPMAQSFIGEQSHLQGPQPADSRTTGSPLVGYRVSDVATHTVCSCGQPLADSDGSVQCAGPDCKFGTFHKACVGLGSRKVTDGWRCYQCRPKPAPGSLPPRSSQLPPSSQLRSSPPPMTIVPTRVMMVAAEPAVPEPPLHPEQESVVQCISDGYNVFYTGSAGTGKSTVLKAFVKRLKEQGKKVDIVAPSGIAALNVGGTTIFAYAGWRPDSFKEPLDKLKAAGFGRNVRKRLCATDVLVVDEISMVERDLLVRLDRVMRHVRDGWKPQDEKGRWLEPASPHRKDMPFGGAQVIVTGDFCQLPPVKPFRTCIPCGGDDLPGYHMQDGRTMTCRFCRQEYKDQDKWAFRSDTWAECEFKYFELKHIHRQSDKRFIDILQKCRYGQRLTPFQQQLLLTGKADSVGAVKLLPRKAEVESENRKNFESLRSAPRRLECDDCFYWRNEEKTPELQKHRTPRYSDKPHGPLLSLKDHRLEEEIQLKEGMLIILLVNLDFKQGLVNGSQGKIIGWETHDDSKVFPPREDRGPPPSKTRPSGKYDSPSKFKRSGSPTRSSRFAKDASTKPEFVQMKEEQVRKYINRNHVTSWPVVEFHNGVVQPIYAHCEMSELGAEEPYSLLGRTQIPLLAAWAITVHKSQGMTLNRVIVDLYNSFEREMVYVALSRARSLEGLKVLRLARQMERGVNEEVQGFLREHGLGGLR